MAQVRSRARFQQQVMNVLTEDLQKAGIKAEIDTQPVRLTKLHRFVVVSRNFKYMKHYERQHVVCGIIERKFDPDEQLRVSDGMDAHSTGDGRSSGLEKKAQTGVIVTAMFLR